MHNKGTHCEKTATIVDTAHHIRRRMRDLREPERQQAGEAFQQEYSTPSFFLFRRLNLSRRTTTRAGRGGSFWFVLGAWLLFAAIICAAVTATLHWRA